ncbi:YagK/YfjJ domain-containing protein [Paraburkholderia fungorum]|uniref:YagK/YfjJ domain-containing protein n=1 Tax=Paraburkholderia fungorum TaxID=134537 RepID=UPI0038BABB7C
MADKARKDAPTIDFEVIEDIDSRLNSARDKNGNIWLLGQYNLTLGMLIRFMNLVIRGNRPAFKEINVHGGKQYLPASKLGYYFKGIHGFLEVYSRDLVFAPHIQVHFNVYRRHPIRYCVLDSPNRISHSGEPEARVFEDFIAKLREEGERINVKKKVADWQRNYKKNSRRLRQYEAYLYRKYARLVWIRIDFLYKKTCVTDQQINEIDATLQSIAIRDQAKYLDGKEDVGERETIARVDIKEMMSDRDHLFENMRGKPSLFEHLAGHIWSLEWSRIGGYHMHCALAFDGSKVHKHEWLADQIGEYWVNVITNGRGWYHNCNRGAYRDYVLGPVEYHETDKRERLLKRLEYLAKKDQFVYVKPSVKCKLFGTGRLPKVAEGGSGRPRGKGTVAPKTLAKGSETEPSSDKTDGDWGPYRN